MAINTKGLLISMFISATFAGPVLAQTTLSVKGEAASKATTPLPNPLKKLSAKKDEMRGITFYKHPSTPHYRNANSVHLYFGKNDDGTFTHLRFVMQYFADDWLFVEKAWSKADGATVELPAIKKFSGWERDNGSGDIWEWSDAALTSPLEISQVRTLANSKSVTVRFEGKQYYKDKKITEKQLSAMREVMAAYETATGKPLK